MTCDNRLRPLFPTQKILCLLVSWLCAGSTPTKRARSLFKKKRCPAILLSQWSLSVHAVRLSFFLSGFLYLYSQDWRG